MTIPRRSALLVLFVVAAAFGEAQTTLTSETANNTAACSGANSYCAGAFSGMSDAASGAYDAAPGNISTADMHALEYSGATTQLFAHFMPWFCMQPGSTATGPGTSCNSHIQVGYNSNDAATVKAQMDDMQARGFNGTVVDWYGPGKPIEDATTQKVKSDLEGRCSGGSCPMSFAIMEDGGSFTRFCPQNGNGTDQSNCILNSLNSDFDYMNTNYFSSPTYYRVDTSMNPSPTGRPVVFFFVCESCYTNPTPNWSYIWAQVRAHVLSYTTGDPLIWFVFRNAGAFTHAESDGGFAWVNHYGTDPYGLLYLDNFYDTAKKFPQLQPWGAAWKGFDNTNAPWKPAVSLTGQQCGSTWLQTFSEMKHNNDYGITSQLPFLQVVTWNDYEEGTEIETGIDNCLSLTASVASGNLSWTPAFSATSGSENTIDHYVVFDSSDGQTLNQVATVSSGTHAIPMNSMTLASGAHTFYVKAVGKASILNKISNAVSYTVNPPSAAPTLASVSPNSGPTAGGTAITITGANFQSGVTVTIGGAAAAVSSVSASAISAVTPAHVAGTVAVTVTNPDSQSATLASGYTYVAPAPAPSFTLSASPTSRTVNKSASAYYSITVTPQNAFAGTVSFSVTGVPSGAIAAFSPTTVTKSGSTTLSVNTRSSSRGTFTLSVKGTSTVGTTTLTSSATVKLTVR